jgi:hypothetical protein
VKDRTGEPQSAWSLCQVLSTPYPKRDIHKQAGLFPSVGECLPPPLGGGRSPNKRIELWFCGGATTCRCRDDIVRMVAMTV